MGDPLDSETAASESFPSGDARAGGRRRGGGDRISGGGTGRDAAASGLERAPAFFAASSCDEVPGSET